MSENVSPMPPLSERLATQIKRDLENCDLGLKKIEEGRKQWIDGAFDLCIHLVEARGLRDADIEFGHWCEDNGFGKDVINHQDRAAAIAMGREPEVLRKCLETTKRRSLQMIYANDFSRFTSASKPTRRKPKTADRAEIEPLAPSEMKPTMQQRYEATLRAAKKQIREELRAEVRAEIHKKYDVYVRHLKEKVARAERIIASHRGVISRREFRIILAGLHPDQNKFEGARKAFELLNGLEDVLVKPEVPAIVGPPLPATVAELLARKRTLH